jgi:hypothetical protein
MTRDCFGTVWYTDGADGVRIPVDSDQEFGTDWPVTPLMRITRTPGMRPGIAEGTPTAARENIRWTPPGHGDVMVRADGARYQDRDWGAWARPSGG